MESVQQTVQQLTMVVQSMQGGLMQILVVPIVFSDNRAQFVGGTYTDQSSLNLPGDNTFTDNTAGNKGGGIYMHKGQR